MEERSDSVIGASEPWQKEANWQSAAIAGAILMLVGFCFVFVWTITAQTADERLMIVQIAAPFGIFGVAAVTFCTVVWRGLISTRQADAQLDQIKGLARQIKSTEENNLAKLLQDGAQLVADNKQPAQVSAGIATLKSIATSETGVFSTEAMDLLADYVQQAYASEEQGLNFSSATAALKEAASMGRRANRSLLFDQNGDGTETQTRSWNVIYGVRSISYEGGKIFIPEVQADDPEMPSMMCKNVRLTGDLRDLTQHVFVHCVFDHCRIRTVDRFAFSYNQFQDCDFTGAEVQGPLDDPGFDLKAGNYFVGTPPVAEASNINWTSILHESNPELSFGPIFDPLHP